MLSRRARIAQLIELCLYAGIGAWLVRSGAWSAAQALAFVVAGFLGVRLFLLVAMFAIAWVYRAPRAPEERIGLAATLVMLLREWAALLLLNLAELPWDRYLMRPDPEPRPAARTPVVLVHGYFANRGIFRDLVRHLEASGVGPVFTPSLRSWMAPIEALEEGLHEAVERIAQASGGQVVLVGHSMGGLAIRAYLARRGNARVARIVTIGSPHHGTAMAPFGQGENARQMRFGSAFLADLARSEGETGPGVPAISLYSPHDNMVVPHTTSRLAWATNISVPGFGHLDLLAAPEVRRVLRETLR